ncbi:endogenous retrovirus group K member 113 Pro protein-like [Equus caballus]|uniref:endogenous retrovirus group K member 113 Pro protein-like n=1 Tax=Equus caballus TaxID=9796 RepID=UPI0038B2DBD1
MGHAGVFLTEKILESQPTCKININGKAFDGLIDTGADVSIISSKHWPHRWPTIPPVVSVIGLGEAQGLRQSSNILHCTGPGGQKSTLQPYVTDLPINLCGRNLLEQWKAEMYIPPQVFYSEQSQKIMEKQQYVPGVGLGKQLQGKVNPVAPSGK